MWLIQEIWSNDFTEWNGTSNNNIFTLFWQFSHLMRHFSHKFKHYACLFFLSHKRRVCQKWSHWKKRSCLDIFCTEPSKRSPCLIFPLFDVLNISKCREMNEYCLRELAEWSSLKYQIALAVCPDFLECLLEKLKALCTFSLVHWGVLTHCWVSSIPCSWKFYTHVKINKQYVDFYNRFCKSVAVLE